MKKTWLYLLLTPLIPLSAAYPIYDEEYDTSYDIELNAQEEAIASESYSDEWNQGVAQDEFNEDSFVYDDPAQGEEVFSTPQRRSKSQNSGDLSLGQGREQRAPKAKAAAPSNQKRQAASNSKRSPVKNNRSTIQGNTSRSKMKDARQNSNRPRVTQRGQEQNNPYNAGQIEADAQEEGSFNYENEQSAPKVRKSPAAVEKKTGHVQRRSSLSQKGVKSNTQRHAKKDRHPKSHHPGKRPLAE